jgi:hypothetical protein
VKRATLAADKCVEEPSRARRRNQGERTQRLLGFPEQILKLIGAGRLGAEHNSQLITPADDVSELRLGQWRNPESGQRPADFGGDLCTWDLRSLSMNEAGFDFLACT